MIDEVLSIQVIGVVEVGNWKIVFGFDHWIAWRLFEERAPNNLQLLNSKRP